ncbi:RuvB-like helicase [Stetteria hydrogenophila]
MSGGLSGELRPRAAAARRVSIHSHIRGLGLDENGKAIKIADGLVGQEKAREAAGVVVEIVKQGKFSGRGILIAGPPGTGKTALAIAIARELGEDTPFVAINASEIYSVEKKKTEVLMQAFRKAIGVKVREQRTVYEGVVASLKYLRGRSAFYPYPVLAGAEITLETTDDSMKLTLGPEIAEQLISLNVKKGDVIMIDADTGAVRRIGRAKGRARRTFDVDLYRTVEIPSGPVKKRKDVVRVFTLHDIDVSIAAQKAVATSLLGLLASEREIDDEVRRRADETVKKLLDEGKAEIVPGVLFIDDAHILDLEAFSFLSKAMESEFAPLIVLATNRGMTKIRGTDIVSPHGIPRDILDRLLIVTTRPYTRDEIKAIIEIRADEEEIPLSEDALELLADIGVEKSLRYAVQLLEPSRVIAMRKGKTKVEREDVEEASRLFVDVKTSVELAEKYGDLMLR